MGPSDASKELTPDEAAEILNVSTAFVIGLLDAAEIPSFGVGAARRISLEEVLAYRERDRIRRREALRALTEEAEALGLGYGLLA
ncbi:MAG: helix-turn-helix domain-containing protein [Polyangiaceae bacterium]|nr:helix-turn-helix domain-containing protein [Polyangiaceae bacterium]MBK8943142.1 helix-turn-helix domain-containing protein [Polyangiaceae bacterium]